MIHFAFYTCVLLIPPSVATARYSDQFTPIHSKQHQKEESQKRPGEQQSKIYRKLFEKSGRTGLDELAKSKDIGLALLASWEMHRVPLKRKPPADIPEIWKYDVDELKKFTQFFEDKTGSQIPDWWSKGLFNLRLLKGQGHLYIPDDDDRPFKEIQINKLKWRVRDGVRLEPFENAIAFRAGDMRFDLPKRGTSVFCDALADVIGKKRSCLAGYQAKGGFSFKVIGFDTVSEKQIWESEVWAVERAELIGPSASHRVEMTLSGGNLFIFGAEGAGLYVESFDLNRGTNIFRFCTSCWRNFPETWGLK